MATQPSCHPVFLPGSEGPVPSHPLGATSSKQVTVLHLGETYFVLKAPQLPSPAKFTSAQPGPLASGGPWTGRSPPFLYLISRLLQTHRPSQPVSHLIVEGLGWLIFKEPPQYPLMALETPQTSMRMGAPCFLDGWGIREAAAHGQRA